MENPVSFSFWLNIFFVANVVHMVVIVNKEYQSTAPFVSFIGRKSCDAREISVASFTRVADPEVFSKSNTGIILI